jgi:hypothetical protein
MNTVQRFKNITLKKVIEVHTDESGTWADGSEVFTEKEIALGRDGHRLNVDQTNKLFAFYWGMGHLVVRL